MHSPQDNLCWTAAFVRLSADIYEAMTLVIQFNDRRHQSTQLVLFIWFLLTSMFCLLQSLPVAAAKSRIQPDPIQIYKILKCVYVGIHQGY